MMNLECDCRRFVITAYLPSFKLVVSRDKVSITIVKVRMTIHLYNFLDNEISKHRLF